jgi:putative transposase
MALFQNKYRIESAHLKDYDYSSQGEYYVTIDIEGNKNILGIVKGQKMFLSQAGIAAEQTWKQLPGMYKNIELGDFVFMPDHMHGIISIREKADKNLHAMIRAFKSKSAIEINRILGTPGGKAWQAGYYDRIIRNEYEYFFVSEYILNNPLVYEEGKGQREWYDLYEERQKLNDKNKKP